MRKPPTVTLRCFRSVVGDRWAEFRPLEKEGEGSLGEKAVIPSGPPGRRSPFYQAFPIPFPFSLTVTYISSR